MGLLCGRMKLPPKNKGISEQLLKLIAYNPIAGLSRKKFKRADGGRVSSNDALGEPRDRATFLFFTPNPNIPDHAQCSSCKNFNDVKGKCFWLNSNDDVVGGGSCGMYGQGKPSGDIVPCGQYTKKDVGYVHHPVRCENCNVFDDRDKSNMHCDLYVQLNRVFPRLFKLDVKVTPRSCCNAQSPGKRNPKRFGPYGPIPDADDPNVGGKITQIIDRRAAGGAVQHMADGGVPSFDQTEPVSSGPPPFEATQPVETPDTGLMSYVPKAITDIPHEAYEATAKQVGNIGKAWSDIRERHAAQAEKDKSAEGSFFDPSAMLGSLKDVADTGKAVVSAASVPVAPIQGTAESLIGHPMAQAEYIVGSIINPKVAAQDNPDQMYEQAKGDVDLALSAARPKGFTARGPIAAPAPVAPQAAGNVAAADEFGIKLSRGQATGDLDTIRYEDMAARGAYGPEAQKKAAEFFDQQFRDTQAAGQS